MCDLFVKTKSDPDHKTATISQQFTTLDEETIEHLIVDLLNEEVTESRIKLAVDFHNKVKGTDVMNLQEPLNMEGYLELELREREEESSPSIH